MGTQLLKNKIAIITGSSAGIGRSTAIALAREGAAVVIQARRAEKLEAVAAEIRAAGGTVMAVPGDSTKLPDIEALLSHAAEFSRGLGRNGAIDILIVNAGRGLAGGLLSSDEKQWRDMYEVNVLAAATLMRRTGNLMIQHGSGDILVLGSASGHNISPFSGFYGASKFAVAAMAEAFRREVCAKGIRVTVLKPGVVESEFQAVAGYTAENFYKGVERFGRLLKPEDVAEVILFAVSRPPGVHVNEIVMRPTGQDYP